MCQSKSAFDEHRIKKYPKIYRKPPLANARKTKKIYIQLYIQFDDRSLRSNVCRSNVCSKQPVSFPYNSFPKFFIHIMLFHVENLKIRPRI